MAIFKCKMCGGGLDLNGDSSVATCDYCGSVQTLPKKNDDVIANLFNRANNLRIKCEFDKASEVYEKIINEDNTEAEAHWGLVLCKYGIEYVEDPKTYKRIPTCHRTQYESVLTDVDYLAAIENADSASKSVYQAQAEAISALQKDILAIVKNEKPFDVFICYKETDENGKRTVDSALANDIYYQLTQEGLKVFYAAITLEDKLGQEYEPYIFAALNSAKVMLVVGTKPEYFDAVWVKNEWSRYLKIMKTDRSKLLIPCYRDMDAYDLPEEFSHLQAQDMSKIGFVNDVVRGIKKVALPTPEEEVTTLQDNSVNTVSDNLINIGFLELQVGNRKNAESQFRKALENDTNNPMAYLGLLLSTSLSEKEQQIYTEKILQLAPQITETEKNIVLKNKDLIGDYICIFLDHFSESRIKYIYDFHNEYIQNPKILGKDKIYYSALSYSISKTKNSKIVSLMLEWGVDPNGIEHLTNEDGKPYSKSVLTYAINNAKSTEMVDLLLKHGANPESIRVHVTGSKIPVLSDAIWNVKNIDMVKLLLEAGANPESVRVLTNGNEYSALSDAIWNAKNVDMVKLLLEAGADPNRVENITKEDEKPYSKSMLTYAINDAESTEMVELLLKYGANPESIRVNTNGNEYSALSDAIWNAKNIDMVKLLLEAGADPNRVENTIDKDGKTFSKSMLTYAVINAKSTEMVDLLLKHGANPESIRVHTTGNEIPVLSDAIWNVKNTDMVKLLLEAGANPESVRTHESGRYSALSDAIWNAKNIDMVKLLLEAGADPNRVENLTDEDGKTFSKSMLTYAIIDAESTEMVELLLKHGATWENKIYIKGISKTEMKYPFDKKYSLSPEFVRFLKSKGWKGSLFFG